MDEGKKKEAEQGPAAVFRLVDDPFGALQTSEEVVKLRERVAELESAVKRLESRIDGLMGLVYHRGER